MRVTPPRFAFGICVSDPPHLRKICARKLGAASTKSYRSNVRKRQNAKIPPESLRLDIASRLEFSLMRREFDRRKENPTFHCVKSYLIKQQCRGLKKTKAFCPQFALPHLGSPCGAGAAASCPSRRLANFFAGAARHRPPALLERQDQRPSSQVSCHCPAPCACIAPRIISLTQLLLSPQRCLRRACLRAFKET